MARVTAALAAFLLCFGLVVATAVAQPEHAPAADAAEQVGMAEAEEEHGAGMPQLDFSTYPGQIFWLFLTFAALYWLLSRKALPRLTEILETREERIAADLDRAARARADAEEALQKNEALLADAHDRAAQQVRAAHEKVTADIAARQAQLERDLNKRLAQEEKRIAAARDATLAQLADVAAEAAQAAVERLTGITVGQVEARRAVDTALGEAR
jgi:F-type H+-transporting ATPase subunit b